MKSLMIIIALCIIAPGAFAWKDTCSNYISSSNFVCNGNPNETQALEIQNTNTSMVSVASGSNPITSTEFAAYPDQVGIYTKNTPRNLQFSSNCLFKSPYPPLNCTNSASSTNPCVTVDTISDFNNTTWGEMALNVCAAYFPVTKTRPALGPAPPGQVCYHISVKYC